MTSSRESFKRDKQLSDWWSSICKTPSFQLVLIYARSELIDGSSINEDQLKGASAFASILSTLCDQEESNQALPKPKIIHDLETDIVKSRAKKTETKKT